MVVSVRELRQLLKEATAGAHKSGRVGRKVGNHTIIIRASVLDGGEPDGDLQFASHDRVVLGGGQ